MRTLVCVCAWSTNNKLSNRKCVCNCVCRQGKPAAAMLEKQALEESVAGQDASAESTHTHKTNSDDDNDEMEQEPVKSAAAKSLDAMKDSERAANVTMDGRHQSGHERTHGKHAHHTKHRAKQQTEEGPQLPETGPTMFYGPHLPTGDDVECGPQLPSDTVEGPHWPLDSVPYSPQMAETAAEKHGHVVKEHDVDRSGSSSKTSTHSDAGSKVRILAEVRHKHLAEQDPSTEAGGHRTTVKHEKETVVPEDSVADEPVVKARDGEEDIEEDDDDDFDDIDMDIDKQLELALEKKKVSDA